MNGLLQFKLASLILLSPELLLLSALPLFVIRFYMMYLNGKKLEVTVKKRSGTDTAEA